MTAMLKSSREGLSYASYYMKCEGAIKSQHTDKHKPNKVLAVVVAVVVAAVVAAVVVAVVVAVVAASTATSLAF
jgi:hypothetical protein